MLKEAFCTRFSPFWLMQFKFKSLLSRDYFPQVFTGRYILMAGSAMHPTACRNENGNWALSRADASASLTCPYLRLHVSGFGMGEAGSPRNGVISGAHMCGPGLSWRVFLRHSWCLRNRPFSKTPVRRELCQTQSSGLQHSAYPCSGSPLPNTDHRCGWGSCAVVLLV